MIPCATKLITHAAITIGRSKESPRRNFRPERMPLCCAAASTRLPARTTVAITRNEKRYVQPSTTSTVAGLAATIRTPASTGPASCVSWFAPDRTAFTLATACSSSPATSGTTSRDEAK
jgi:hypothetical protein